MYVLHRHAKDMESTHSVRWAHPGGHTYVPYNGDKGTDSGHGSRKVWIRRRNRCRHIYRYVGLARLVPSLRCPLPQRTTLSPCRRTEHLCCHGTLGSRMGCIHGIRIGTWCLYC